jgi:hypothetical protein
MRQVCFRFLGVVLSRVACPAHQNITLGLGGSARTLPAVMKHRKLLAGGAAQPASYIYQPSDDDLTLACCYAIRVFFRHTERKSVNMLASV